MVRRPSQGRHRHVAVPEESVNNTVVSFPAVPAAKRRSRARAADALRECLDHLSEEAQRADLPLTAELIAAAALAIAEDLDRP